MAFDPKFLPKPIQNPMAPTRSAAYWAAEAVVSTLWDDAKTVKAFDELMIQFHMRCLSYEDFGKAVEGMLEKAEQRLLEARAQRDDSDDAYERHRDGDGAA